MTRPGDRPDAGPTRVLLVDDHQLFRESLGRLLESTPEFQVAAQCGSMAAALAALERAAVDVVLLDFDLGKESGLGLLEELTRRAHPPRVLIVTAGMPDEATLHAMELGAAGIFPKQRSPEQLLAAIRQVAQGEVWVDQAALHALLAGRQLRADTQVRDSPLTPRQAAVLRGILDGLSNKEIAARLRTSESSVKAAIQELFQKAGVRTRSQLVRIAIERHASDWLPSGH